MYIRYTYLHLIGPRRRNVKSKKLLLLHSSSTTQTNARPINNAYTYIGRCRKVSIVIRRPPFIHNIFSPDKIHSNSNKEGVTPSFTKKSHHFQNFPVALFFTDHYPSSSCEKQTLRMIFTTGNEPSDQQTYHRNPTF